MRKSGQKDSAGPVMLSATIELPRRTMATPAVDWSHDASSATGSATGRSHAGARALLVEDISPAGFRFLSPERMPIGTEIRLDPAGVDPVVAAATVVQRDGDTHRCTFREPLTAAQLASFVAVAGRVPGAVGEEFAERWPGLVRGVIFIGGGAAAWAAAVALLRGLG